MKFRLPVWQRSISTDSTENFDDKNRVQNKRSSDMAAKKNDVTFLQASHLRQETRTTVELTAKHVTESIAEDQRVGILRPPGSARPHLIIVLWKIADFV